MAYVSTEERRPTPQTIPHRLYFKSTLLMMCSWKGAKTVEWILRMIRSPNMVVNPAVTEEAYNFKIAWSQVTQFISPQFHLFLTILSPAVIQQFTRANYGTLSSAAIKWAKNTGRFTGTNFQTGNIASDISTSVFQDLICKSAVSNPPSDTKWLSQLQLLGIDPASASSVLTGKVA